MSPPGTLYGVGVGPGDPELITRRAARLIGAAPVIAFPSLPGQPSLARSIVADLIPPAVREIVIEVPMTEAREPAQAAYDTGAAAIAEALATGADVVVLCEGDPFFYGSFMYLHARLTGRFRVEVVPGVSALTACAALAGRPLAARNDALTVLPAPLPDAALRAHLTGPAALAILKVGRHLPRLKALVAEAGLMSEAVFVARAGLTGQQVCPLAEAPEPAPYFSMILIAKGADPWL